jgi:hypothetical protein
MAGVGPVVDTGSAERLSGVHGPSTMAGEGSRRHRDRVNAKVMKDSRLANMGPKSMPFDPKRMVYGGFTVIVDA